jgi:hypothetical protein
VSPFVVQPKADEPSGGCVNPLEGFSLARGKTRPAGADDGEALDQDV